MSFDLRDRVEGFIRGVSRPEGQSELLEECIKEGSLSALSYVTRMYEDQYDGITFNMELKAPAAIALLMWKELGLRSLVEACRRNPTLKNRAIAIELLSSVAAGEPARIVGTFDSSLMQETAQMLVDNPQLAEVARAQLSDLMLSLEEDDIALSLGNVFMAFYARDSSGSRELVRALSTRWLSLSSPVLDAFETLISTSPDDEPAFQRFISSHPQILDPLAVRVWPQPDLFGFKEPDFVVQRADGTYVVVEIECPGKRLVTSGGQLSSEVTHAEQQVTDYRRYMVQRFTDTAAHFPQFQEPDCLVVIGVERDLSLVQRQALHDANRNRQHLRIVGFDWLLERARAITRNVREGNVEMIDLRVV